MSGDFQKTFSFLSILATQDNNKACSSSLPCGCLKMGTAVVCSSGDSPASHFATSFSVGLSLGLPTLPAHFVRYTNVFALHHCEARWHYSLSCICKT